MKLMTQLAFGGQCRVTFETFGEHQGKKLPPGSIAASADQIRSSALQGGGQSILGNDLLADRFLSMRAFKVAVHTHSAADAERILDALSEGAGVTTPFAKVDWASCSAWALISMACRGSSSRWRTGDGRAVVSGT